MARRNQKAQLKFLKAFVFAQFIVLLNACALGPVETDPEAASERFAKMAQDCYKRGGTWNDNVKTCVGADLGRNW